MESLKSDWSDNNAVHTEDGIARLQMENQTAVPGDGCRYPTGIWRPSPLVSRRQLLTFSLRSVFAMFALSGTAFWFVRRRWTRSQRQAQLVDEIQRLGGVVGYAHEWDDVADRGTGLPNPGPALLRQMLGDHFFLTPTLIMFDESDVSTDELPEINELPFVTHLDFSHCPNIDDRIADRIVQMPRLKVICLYGSPISFSAMRRFSCLSDLQTLHAPHTLLDKDSAAELTAEFDEGVVSWNDDPIIKTSTIFATLKDGG